MRRARRLGVCIVAAAACTLAAFTSTALARTKLTLFVPFTAADKPALPVHGGLKDGGCYQRSQITPESRDDAWICQVGQTLHDPCFLGSDPNKLLCPASDMRSAMLVYDGPVGPPKPHRAPSASGAPFNVELANGTHCVYSASGETASFGLKSAVLHYQCPHNLGLWGAFDEHGPTWTITGAPAQGNISAYHRVERVIHVWR